MNIEYVYFKTPVHVRSALTTKPFHALSHDRHTLEVKGNWLSIEIDGYITMVPLHNVSSVTLKQE